MEGEETPAETKTPKIRRTPTPSANGGTPQAITAALLEAQGNKCDCRPCQLLRLVVRELSDGILKAGKA